MLNFTIFEFILVNMISYFCGVGTGLIICCKNKETFMQREKSVENLQQYNHQAVQGYATAPMPSAPHVSEICIKN